MTDDLKKRLREGDHFEKVMSAGEALARIEELEAKLAKLTKAADRVHDSYWNATDGIIVGMFDLGEALREARTTLAELTGGKDD